MTFQTIKDFYCYISNLYINSASIKEYITNYNQIVNNSKLLDDNKLTVKTTDEFRIVLKACYCIEITEEGIYTPFQVAPKIAASISRNILLGTFPHNQLTTKQKEMFHKSMKVDLSQYDLIEKSALKEPDFIKDLSITFDC